MKYKIFENIIALDTETTGVDIPDEIIEFCSTTVENNELTSFVYRFKPSKSIPAEASAVHFISDFDLSDEDNFNGDKSTHIMDLINSKVFILGHNLNFDMDMLYNNLSRTNKFSPEELKLIQLKERRICTLELAKKLYAEDESFKNLTLSYLWFKLGLNVKYKERNITPHKAEDDVFMCIAVLESLIDEFINRNMITLGDDLGEQLNHIATTPLVYKKMPFGKHKGELVANVPISYLNWLIMNSEILDKDKPNYDANFAATVEFEIERRNK